MRPKLTDFEKGRGKLAHVAVAFGQKVKVIVVQRADNLSVFGHCCLEVGLGNVPVDGKPDLVIGHFRIEDNVPYLPKAVRSSGKTKSLIIITWVVGSLNL